MSNKQNYLRFWCQKVLPLVYDDSLSYYELLNKVVAYLNNTIKDVNTLADNMDSLNESFIELQEYVDEKVGNLEELIDKELQQLIDEGAFDELIENLPKSDTTPLMDSENGSAGTSSQVSRGDHQHPKDTTKANSTTEANNYSTSATYAIGDYCTYLGNLYKCNTAISTPEAWNSSHWTIIKLTDEMLPKSNGVTNVFYDSGSHKIKKTINGSNTDVIDVEDTPTNASNKLPSSKGVFDVINHSNRFYGKDVLMLGDSWCRGFVNLQTSDTDGWSVTCEQYLKCSKTKVQMSGGGFAHNASNSGDYPNHNYAYVLDAMHDLNKDFYAIIVQGGVNDIMNHTESEITTGMNSFMSKCNSYFPKALVYYIPTFGVANMTREQSQLFAAIIMYARVIGMIVANEALNWFLDYYVYNYSALSDGGNKYHLTTSGYAFLGRMIANFVKSGNDNIVANSGWQTTSGNNPCLDVIWNNDVVADDANRNLTMYGHRNILSLFMRVKIISTATTGWATIASNLPFATQPGIYLHVGHNDRSIAPVPRVFIVNDEVRMFFDGNNFENKVLTIDGYYLTGQNLR